MDSCLPGFMWQLATATEIPLVERYRSEISVSGLETVSQLCSFYFLLALRRSGHVCRWGRWTTHFHDGKHLQGLGRTVGTPFGTGWHDRTLASWVFSPMAMISSWVSQTSSLWRFYTPNRAVRTLSLFDSCRTYCHIVYIYMLYILQFCMNNSNHILCTLAKSEGWICWIRVSSWLW